MRLLKAAVAVWVLSGGFAAASILTVDDDPGADYTSISAAINVAGYGDIVSVAPGQYPEFISITTDGISVIGSGQGISVVFASGGGASPPLVTLSGVTNDTVFEGFTIHGNNNEGSGGGLLIENGGGVFRNNEVRNNVAQSGGGVYLSQSNARIEGNYIHDNLAIQGSGMLIIGGDPVVRNNVIKSNGGANRGGGLYVVDAGVEITSNTFWANVANASPATGAGLYIECSGSTAPVPKISNNSITNNNIGSQTSGTGLGIFVETACSADPAYDIFFANNNVWNNIKFGSNFPQIDGAIDDTLLDPGASSNISVDPRFAPGSDNFRLATNSQMIDAGFLFPEFGCMGFGLSEPCVDLVYPAWDDADGIPRPQSAVVTGEVKFFRAHPLSYTNPPLLGTFNWNKVTGGGDFPAYNIYRGLLSQISTSYYGDCHQEVDNGSNTQFDQRYDEVEDPPISDAFFYVVTGENIGICQVDIGAYELNGEGPFGNDWQGNPRPNLNPCLTSCDNYF